MQNKLLVTTSTFPRWEADSTPGFIKDLTDSYSSHFNIKVLTPHYHGSKVHEKTENFSIKRYRYFYPYKYENIVYDGGGGNKISKNLLYVIKLLFLLTSQFFNTLYYRAKGYKIIHAHWIIPQGFIAVLVKKIIKTKVILSVHGSDITTLNGKILKKIKAFTLMNADVVTVNSKNTEMLCDQIHKRDYKVIPMGIDIVYFKKRPKNPDNKVIRLVFVGRLSKEKGVDKLINIIGSLKNDAVNFKLDIIGEGDKRNDLDKYISKSKLSKNITLHGWQNKEKLIEYLYRADLFISTSYREAQGIAIIEALSCGVPVVSTDVGGVSDAVNDGYNGFLINPNDTEGFASKIEYLSKNRKLLEKISNNAAKGIQKKYSWIEIGGLLTKLIS